jgi:hypothetical protein
MLTVLTYLWHDPNGKHNAKYRYGADDVRLLRKMVRRHLTVPHDFAVVTDMAEAFAYDIDIRVIAPRMETHVPGTCFRRLFTFHPDGREIFGKQVLQLDLDSVITGNLDALAARPENLVMWRNPTRLPWNNPAKPGRCCYNTSCLLHRPGTMPNIWWDFLNGPRFGHDDQWHLSGLLGPNWPYFDGENDGVYRVARPDTPGSGVDGVLPENARIVFFTGSEGKWFEPHIQAANPWIAEHRV